MAPDGDTDWISRLNDLASLPTESLDQAVTKLVLLPIAALFISFAETIEAIFNLITQPLFAMGTSIAAFVEAVIGGGADIVSTGADASATGTQAFGILGFVVGLGVTLLGAYLLLQYLAQDETSDTIPFTATDLPFVGADEDSQ
jgi:hypothetical protein